MRLIQPHERFHGQRTVLRLLTLEDCNDRYVSWLRDPDVNRHLETRWTEQTLTTVRDFVASMIGSRDSYLFAILDLSSTHVGNLKIGPVHARHAYADISYFIGDRSQWGRGLASDAIATAAAIAFERLGLHRVQAGLYEGNVGSARALEKAGFLREGIQRQQLRTGDGRWEDHVWYGLVRDEWTSQSSRATV